MVYTWNIPRIFHVYVEQLSMVGIYTWYIHGYTLYIQPPGYTQCVVPSMHMVYPLSINCIYMVYHLKFIPGIYVVYT
jgi:hypothetical protein